MLITKQQAKAAIFELEGLKDSLYQVGFDFGGQSEKMLSEEAFVLLKSYLQKTGADLANSAQIGAAIEKLMEKLIKLPSVNLTLAFEPSFFQLQRIFGWLQVNARENLLIELAVDAKILGGAIVEFEGKRRDYSVKKKLEELNKLGI